MFTNEREFSKFRKQFSSKPMNVNRRGIFEKPKFRMLGAPPSKGSWRNDHRH